LQQPRDHPFSNWLFCPELPDLTALRLRNESVMECAPRVEGHRRGAQDALTNLIDQRRRDIGVQAIKGRSESMLIQAGYPSAQDDIEQRLTE